MQAAEQLIGFSQSTLWSGFIVFLRVGAVMAVLPAFGEQSVPVRVKLGVTVAFTFIVAPAALTTFEVPDQMLTGLPIFVTTEVIAGLAIGLSVRLFVLALQITGTIAAQSTSLSQIFGGAGVDPQPAMGYILVVAGLALAVMTGLHVRAAELIVLSYDIMPAGEFPDARMLSVWGVQRVAHAFALAFTLAAPFFIASLIYNVALGVINRAMPQLMVAFVGAPAITAGGLILLMLSAPVLLKLWVESMNAFMANPVGV
ncbi:flagellar biosynthetic protein FliR [Parasulfitobacter algicola]|uniref:Flagellar biosynthetic protein FliR n=1 Tax=Parasulfitobacter algicola TaxID=2614809 RepID=A0ABX2IX01_9RHOB|nr:flagellar biosynthetic protein FliR [Sulfitobacter algicola]NSX54668.1 flagellar biosynthetic protein FliR [Sulfitobacter algicola]